MKFEERELSIYIILRNALVDKRTRSVVAVAVELKEDESQLNLKRKRGKRKFVKTH